MSRNSSLSRSSDSSRSLGEDQREALYLMLQQEGWQVYLRLVQQDLQSVLSRLESQEDPTQLFRAQGELAAIRRLTALPRDILAANQHKGR